MAWWCVTAEYVVETNHRIRQCKEGLSDLILVNDYAFTGPIKHAGKHKGMPAYPVGDDCVDPLDDGVVAVQVCTGSMTWGVEGVED